MLLRKRCRYGVAEVEDLLKSHCWREDDEEMRRMRTEKTLLLMVRRCRRG